MKTLSFLSGHLPAAIKFLAISFLLSSNAVTSGFAQKKHKPNILFILLDDARYDMFAPNGGPSFFNTPAINRIAEEGVNFKFTGVTTALCVPSRASIYTGLYMHHHGALDNETSPKAGLTYISSILQSNGYYTGFVGKWLLDGDLPDTPIGFDYWAVTDWFKHKNPVVRFNDGRVITYYEHDTRVYTNLAIDFLKNKVPPGKPWVLFLFHRVPHTPLQPFTADETMYQNVQIDFPDNFSPYQNYYPSVLYPAHQYEGDSTVLDQNTRDYYETCNGAEYSVDSVLSYLEANEILDSTLVLFSSDNGLMLGEHDLQFKSLAYDESLRVPLFIRYPAWFAAGTVVDNEFAANIDIAPTLLEAAGIPDTFNMDGLSLHELAQGNVHRKYFFLEHYPAGSGCKWEAVRSSQYKYIYYYCNSTTEEFFDLTNDPNENNNLVFDANYTSLLEQYRQKRNSLRLATDDTINPVMNNCSLILPDFFKDGDGDGYGDSAISIVSSIAPSGYVSDNSDCNDADSSIHPEAIERCNSIDDNCDGLTEPDFITATVSPDGKINTCKGTAITFTANSGSGISYQWLKNGVAISGATNQIHTSDQSGTYQVQESANSGCYTTSIATLLNVQWLPKATISPSGTLNICATGLVVLQANSGSNYYYQWRKGVSDIAGATNQTYSATTKGTYRVTVFNSSNCSKLSGGVQVINSCREESSANDSSSVINVFPNPSHGKFTIEIAASHQDNSEALIQIRNTIGQVIYEKQIELHNGLQQIPVNISGRRSGMYSLKITVNDELITMPLAIAGED